MLGCSFLRLSGSMRKREWLALAGRLREVLPQHEPLSRFVTRLQTAKW
jgi:hypothetical protein